MKYFDITPTPEFTAMLKRMAESQRKVEQLFGIPNLSETEPNCATGQSCQMGPHGPGGSIQCQYCGAVPEAATKPFDCLPLDLGPDWTSLKPEDEVQPSLLEVSDEVKKFLDGAIGCVEANSFERMSLYGDFDKAADDWKDNTSGLGITLGMVAKMPVCISLNSAVVNGHKIIFYSATSVMVDWRMVTDWLKAHMPETAFKDERLNKVDAMNFHNVFPRG
ncbi:hypothetical protein LOKG_00075 [Loktanella phage pCB2051-A]|uniref:Uncharacterized protein n=1 Tax=Loktanella phage pCB2051-A TaxID=754044 RepID=M4QP59_9CAUD|nr:hypothetical protein LOKG_00075 [Loktanella phage pCB2051-A]AGH31511.1 hypothetical protein LOKG_00075 [Loktanella phage pCB2051-A]